ncbi:hypothetical protein S40285_01781 [Stachybotrys chlorohalonatus IBT 40285]|uniref:Uncharacterized protein n=1 Tax=Stachybotrys chlorohalonatus (strain IBT 40285) TaxID=1283841 RepID=A0A084R298_STAC4|nr:hypothetical protein S40285_01781 [Stachybotrys chlorohalonata IBT 40285]
MKAAVLLTFVASAMAGLLQERACAGNNCKRQVTGTRAGLLPLTERMADCSSFQATTVVPDAVTTTVTVTVEAGEPAKFKRAAGLQYRAETEIPTAIPAYASACTSAADYAEACSCWGITATVSTAPTPTSTATVTVTADYCEDL